MKKGFEIRIKSIIEIEGDWREAEIKAIRDLRENGFDLLNIQKGGNCPDYSKIKNKRMHELKTLICQDLKNIKISKLLRKKLQYLVDKNPIEFRCFKKYL